MDELYVILESPTTDSDESLEKNLPLEYVHKPVVETIKYMTEPYPDEINPLGYNSDQINKASLVKAELEEALYSDNSEDLYQVNAVNKNNEKIHLDLTTKLSEYKDEILLENQDQNFKSIHLVVSTFYVAGLEKEI